MIVVLNTINTICYNIVDKIETNTNGINKDNNDWSCEITWIALIDVTLITDTKNNHNNNNDNGK